MAGAAAVVLAIATNAAHGASLGSRASLPNCYMETDPINEVGGGKGKSYRGLTSSTVSGRTCKNWLEVDPKDVDWTAAPDRRDGENTVWGDGTGNHNFCRNPDQSQPRPWCFTVDPEQTAKELCEVPECPKKERNYAEEAATLSSEIGATDCDCMDQLYGSSVTTADTAVPLTLLAKGKRCDCTKRQL
eukprot:TRINITY_DN1313_c0_g1_i14.p1 TRINITY_DN1313_c0_g1~~TRINITY_DN1313_c0_g1_i14.p1  ORF type:complete len:207 (+),score=27.50 TRINITY_DN1313_c0_g1_i14:59-622(+)